jgi:hypothetical protein
MPMALRAVEHWQPALRSTANENLFRELMARSHENWAIETTLISSTGNDGLWPLSATLRHLI